VAALDFARFTRDIVPLEFVPAGSYSLWSSEWDVPFLRDLARETAAALDGITGWVIAELWHAWGATNSRPWMAPATERVVVPCLVEDGRPILMTFGGATGIRVHLPHAEYVPKRMFCTAAIALRDHAVAWRALAPRVQAPVDPAGSYTALATWRADRAAIAANEYDTIEVARR
jgi:hypothetical protein